MLAVSGALSSNRDLQKVNRANSGHRLSVPSELRRRFTPPNTATYERDTQVRKQGRLDSDLGNSGLKQQQQRNNYVHSLANVYAAS